MLTELSMIGDPIGAMNHLGGIAYGKNIRLPKIKPKMLLYSMLFGSDLHYSTSEVLILSILFGHITLTYYYNLLVGLYSHRRSSTAVEPWFTSLGLGAMPYLLFALRISQVRYTFRANGVSLTQLL